jgi:hypothetical protein
MTELDAVTRDYRVAFLRYLSRREESALHRGYQLGRSAVVDGLSMLDLARIHHLVLLEVLAGSHRTSEDVTGLAAAASEFLLEVLATYDMTQRAFRDTI